jgi:LPXTG-motif cell wall-anchored protein
MKCTVSGETEYENIRLSFTVNYNESLKAVKTTFSNGFNDTNTIPGYVATSPTLEKRGVNGNFSAYEITIINNSNEVKNEIVKLSNITMQERSSSGDLTSNKVTLDDKSINVKLLGDSGITRSTENDEVDGSINHELSENDKQKLQKALDEYNKSLADSETTEESSESTGDVVENPKTGVSDNVYLLVLAMAILGLTIILSRNFKFFRKLK